MSTAPIGGMITALVLTAVLGLQVLHARYRLNDRRLSLVLGLAILFRLLLGFVNHLYGPLPGAEVDAVLYESYAADLAREIDLTGQWSFDFGRLGYSNIIAVAYLFGGRSFILVTLLNTIFVLAGLICIYRVVRELSGQRQAVGVTAAVALYPTLVLYTAVPLREPVLFWALALGGSSLVRAAVTKRPVVDWRIVLAFVVLTWLHTGFLFVAAAIPLVWYARFSQAGGKVSTVRVLLGAGVVTIVVLGGWLMLLRFGTGLPKFPTDPSALLDLGHLDSMRRYKASYGTGYLGEASTSWAGFVLQLPLMVIGFLYAPTPLDMLRSGGLMRELPKVLDGIILMGLTVMFVNSVRTGLRQKRQVPALLGLVALLVVSVLVFAVGTANIGIAIRHRAKFVWLLLIVIGIWHPRFSAHATRRPSRAVPAVRTAGPVCLSRSRGL